MRTGAPSPGVKRMELGADAPLLYSPNIMNAWSYTSTPPTPHVAIVKYLQVRNPVQFILQQVFITNRTGKCNHMPNVITWQM